MFIWQRKLKYRIKSTKKHKKRCCYHKQHIIFKRVKFTCILCSIIIALIFLINTVEARIDPLINDLSLSNLQSIVTKESNYSVNEVLSENSVTYDTLVNKTTDNNGNTKSLSLNYTELNQLKSELTLNIQKKIDQINSVDIYIPILAMVSDNFYSGYGFPLRLKVLTDENVKVDFCDEYTSVGINQTKHLIKVKITVEFGINVPIRGNGDDVITEVPIAETVIVGDVPNAYLDLN